jgi:tetratricopeptide (TPR) repeat protein
LSFNPLGLRFAACALMAAGLLACAPAQPAALADPELKTLFAELGDAPDALSAELIERQIWNRWTLSGSPTVDVLLERASAAEAAGDPQLARAFLIEAAELAPDFAEPWSRRAALAYDAQDYQGAILAIEETLKREPRHFAALAGLGVIYEELGEPRAALAAYRAALEIHPNFTSARLSAARLEVQLSGRDA